jgi:plasmid stabilization system protein ParE
MGYQVLVLPEAIRDIADCATWYTEHHDSSGWLAETFLDAIEQTIERIKSNPTLYAIRHDEVRSIMVRRDAPTGQPRRFPHLIFYRVRDLEITIVQVFPMKNDPRRLRG